MAGDGLVSHGNTVLQKAPSFHQIEHQPSGHFFVIKANIRRQIGDISRMFNNEYGQANKLECSSYCCLSP